MDEEGKAQAVQRFLVCAEARYICYINLLDVFFGQIDPQAKHDIEKCQEIMPLPSWSVPSPLIFIN